MNPSNVQYECEGLPGCDYRNSVMGETFCTCILYKPASTTLLNNNELPHEILAEIFSFIVKNYVKSPSRGLTYDWKLQPTENRTLFTLRNVSAHWRSVVDGPLLWTTFSNLPSSVTEKNKPGYTRSEIQSFLTNSQQVPLNLYLQPILYGHSQRLSHIALFDIFVAEITRWRTLDLVLDQELLDRLFALNTQILPPFPLISLVISLVSEDLFERRDTLEQFTKHMFNLFPKIERLEWNIHGLKITEVNVNLIIPWNQLTHITLDYYSIHFTQAITRLLPYCTNATSIALRIVPDENKEADGLTNRGHEGDGEDENLNLSNGAIPVSNFPNLTDLRLFVDKDRAQIIQVIQAPKLRTFHLVFTGWEYGPIRWKLRMLTRYLTGTEPGNLTCVKIYDPVRALDFSDDDSTARFFSFCLRRHITQLEFAASRKSTDLLYDAIQATLPNVVNAQEYARFTERSHVTYGLNGDGNETTMVYSWGIGPEDRLSDRQELFEHVQKREVLKFAKPPAEWIQTGDQPSFWKTKKEWAEFQVEIPLGW